MCKDRWFHGWLMGEVEKEITVPKLGPYDPRSDEQRTWKHTLDVCVFCGKERDTKMYAYRVAL